MKAPDYFVDMGTPWCDWARTELELNNNRVIAGTAPFGSVAYREYEVEGQYPGFIKALERLSEFGCDRKFVTHVLKFCILHAEGMNLVKFLDEYQLQAKVETALAIGLSGEELTQMLTNGTQSSLTALPPEDFNYSTET